MDHTVCRYFQTHTTHSLPSFIDWQLVSTSYIGHNEANYITTCMFMFLFRQANYRIFIFIFSSIMQEHRLHKHCI